MGSILTPNYGFTNTFGDLPKEGPKAVPMSFDFSASLSYSVDFSQLVRQQVISLIQSVYIDNSGNASSFILSMDGTFQSVIAAPGSQGYYSVLMQSIPKITASSSGGVKVIVEFINVPVPPAVWFPASTASGSNVTIVSPIPLPVSIDGLTTPNPIPVIIDGLTTPNPIPVSVSSPVNTLWICEQLTLPSSYQELYTILHAARSTTPTSCKSLSLQGDISNSLATYPNQIYVSDSGSSPGFSLSPGQSVSFDNIDLTQIYVSGTAGQYLNCIVVN